MASEAKARVTARSVEPLAPRRVLVVGDDPTFQLLAAETLRMAGFEVQAALNAQDALAALGSFAPELVILDTDVPGGTGFEICRRIRAGAAGVELPVIMVTGLDDTASINEAYQAGATDFMHKPVLWPALPHRVNFLLRAYDDKRQLARSERKNRALLQALPDASVIVDRAGVITEHFPGSDAPTRGSLSGKRLEDAFPASLAHAARRLLRQGMSQARSTHVFAIEDGGTQRWFEARLRCWADGSLLIVTRDTTERYQAKARMEFLAYYDVLTQLPNRTLFMKRGAEILQKSRDGGTVAVLSLDLDRFRRVNDNLGHGTGDKLLKVVARRLQDLVARSPATGASAAAAGGTEQPLQTVARLGGDEFVMVSRELREESEAADIAERVRVALSEPAVLGDHQLVITPSLGIAIYPRDSGSLDDLLVKADMAMYMAKDRGRNCHAFFGQSVAVRSLGRLSIETDMREGMRVGQFQLAYQPKVSLATGRITGFEALLRWTHPERGEVLPERFIPVAEETGLIVPLGEWVLTQTCRQLKRWTDMGFTGLTGAINVSVQQFERRDFVDTVLRALEQCQLQPAQLELEITESLLSRNLAQITESMRRFRKHGIALSIDDFGTGYSSLGYLRQFPVSTLKIDRMFVQDLDRSEDGAAICSAIIALGRELKLGVIAEGVERAEQLEFLRAQRCDQAQGFLIGRPVPYPELEAQLLGGPLLPIRAGGPVARPRPKRT